MMRHLGYGFVFAGALALAACTSQPAMAPVHIAGGKLVVEQPPAGKIRILTPAQENQMLNLFAAGFAGAMIGGEMGMLAAESNVAGSNAVSHGHAVKILQPYAGLIDTAQFAEGLRDAGAKAVATVPWFTGSGSGVMLADQPGWIKQEQMKQITEASGVNAVAFMSPQIVLSPDLKTLYVYAVMRVYAAGAHGRPTFLDGGDLLAAAKLGDTKPALDGTGVGSIAAGKTSDAAALGARANLWFANDGVRIRQALAKAEEILAVKLHNFLTGRRGTSNPYKA